MRATHAEIAVANRLLHFNCKVERLYIGAGNIVTATGVLENIVNTVSNMQQLTAKMPDFFRPFRLDTPAHDFKTIAPNFGQQTLF